MPDWVRTFGDSELNRLVEDAVTCHPDLAVAAVKVEASRAAMRVAAGALYPRVGPKLMGEGLAKGLSGDVDLRIDPPNLGGLGVESNGGGGDRRSVGTRSFRGVGGLGRGASWEIAGWGRIRTKAAAAQADSDAAGVDYKYARHSFAATVVKAWLSTIEVSQQAANTAESRGLYNEYLKLTEVRQSMGFASDYDTAQIKIRVADAKDIQITADDDESPAETLGLWDQPPDTAWEAPVMDPGDGRTPVLADS